MRAPTLGATLAVIAAGWALAGWGVALLTLGLDPRLLDHGTDFWILGGYGLGTGLVVGASAGVGVWLVVRAAACCVAERIRWAVVFAVAMVPLVYLALLPDTGLTGRLLTDLLFTGSMTRRLAVVLGFAGVCGLLGWLATAVAERLAGLAGPWERPVVRLAAIVAVGFVGLSVGLWPHHDPIGSVAAPAAAEEVALPMAGDPDPAPVVLLLSDGIDPRVVREMVDAGELPTFARLEREGTYGPLGTIEPTLSPIIWTTVATGRPPEEHGIRHFLYFRLPGIRTPIGQWPLHTGLNFEIFPRLEAVFGTGLRRPYTSAMRREDALWDLVGRFHRVGVYRWLLSWPAEPVDGFFVAGGMGWVDLGGSKNAAAMSLDSEDQAGASVHPPGLWSSGRPERFSVTPEAMAEILDDGVSPDDPRLRSWRGALLEPTLAELPVLMDRFDPAFVAASFQPVDGAHHLFGTLRGRDVPFGGAVDVFYHLLDRRLGRFLDTLGPDTRVLLISDHGFDFVHGHHTHGPPGVLYGIGPGFEAGRTVDVLNVYDIAPLILRLLDLPLPEDLPGTIAGRYQQALDPAWAAAHAERRVATYGRSRRDAATPIEDDAELRDLLETLGYVE
ncbi:MAG: alkaline phosphatase family protein [Acidobacteriota bacterium]